MLFCGSKLCFKLLLITNKFFFFGFYLFIKTHCIFSKICNVLFYAQSFFAGNFALFQSAHKIFQLTAAVNQKVIEFLLLTFFQIRLAAAKFKLACLKPL